MYANMDHDDSPLVERKHCNDDYLHNSQKVHENSDNCVGSYIPPMNSLRVCSAESVYSEKRFNLSDLRKRESRGRNSSVSPTQRSFSIGSDELSDEYGWFEDFESPNGLVSLRKGSSSNSTSPDELGTKQLELSSMKRNRIISFSLPVSETPMYILESTLYNQRLWYETAGKRPKQPDDEREYFEKLWLQNFQCSSAIGCYNKTYNCNNIHGHVDKSKRCRASVGEEWEEIVFKGKGPFSNAVSRAFLDHHLSTITLQMPRFKVSKDENGDVFASFLVVVAVNGITFGVWKRHTDFKELANKLQNTSNADKYDHITTHNAGSHYNLGGYNEHFLKANEDASDANSVIVREDDRQNTGKNGNIVNGKVNFKNSLLSWQCLMYRKQWFRCLDKGLRYFKVMDFTISYALT